MCSPAGYSRAVLAGEIDVARARSSRSRWGAIALEAPTGESGLAHRLERAYFGHESYALGAEGRPFPGQLKKSGLARGGILA